jgi:cytosine/adenosine deaminase-related metal-dependent hydrolase
MAKTVDLVVRNATIITMNGAREIIVDGAVAIHDGRIEKVCPARAIGDLQGKTEIDAKNGIVLPGLVNPHVHLSYSLGRGCGDDLPFPKWLPVVYRLEDAYTEGEWYLSCILTMIEMIKSGTTTFADTNVYEEIDTVVKAVADSGMRGVLGKIIRDEESEELQRNPVLRQAWTRDHPRSLSVASAVADWKKHHGAANGRISVRLSPAVWPVCSKKSYLEAADASKRLGIGKLIHHTETREWKAFVEKEYGKEPTFMLNDFGMLGPDTLLENMAWLSDAEIKLLADTGTPINYLPTSNVKNYLGVLDIPGIAGQGVSVSLGTSGGLINNINDMFREMFVLALQQRQLRQQPDAISPEDILEMATITGAKTLNLESQVGSLEPGKRADLIVVDTNKPHLVPVVNPLSTLLYGATGADVDSVVIDGNLVMKHRNVLSLGEAEIVEAAQRDGLGVLKRTKIFEQPQCRCRWPQLR